MQADRNIVESPHDAHADVPPDGVVPIPPRFWWLKRIGIGVGVLIVSLVVLRIWWGWEANRRLQAEIDRIVAAGEPFYPKDYEDFRKVDVPDELNAAVLYKQAGAAYVPPPPGANGLFDASQSLREFEKHPDEVRPLLEQNAAALALVRKARDLPYVNWGDPGGTAVGDSLSNHRELSRLLAMVAYNHYRAHDHAAFIDCFRDLRALSAAQVSWANAISLLVGISIEARALHLIETLGMTLAVDSGRASDEATKGVSRIAIATIIRELLDEGTYRRAIVLASHRERTYIYSQYTAVLAARAGMTWSMDRFADVLLDGPLLKLKAARDLRSGGSSLLAALKPIWPAGKAIYGKKATGLSLVHHIADPLNRWTRVTMNDPLLHSAFLMFKLFAKRRMCATVLGIRLYELDHGLRPASLEDLVPDYLPYVPLDPFAANESPIQYARRTGGDILYSVGVNAIDDGGAFDAGTDAWRDSQADFVLNLDGSPGDETSHDDSGQALDHDQNADDDGGDAGDDDHGEDQPEQR